MRKTSAVYLLLGSNLGDRAQYLEQARDMIGKLPDCRIVGASSVRETEALGMPSWAGMFLNQVVVCEMDDGPLAALEKLEKIERLMGRKNKGQALPRTIDIDILLYGKVVMDSVRLTIPHARLADRIFALEPLVEVCPGLVDPRSATAYAGILSELSRRRINPHTPCPSNLN